MPADCRAQQREDVRPTVAVPAPAVCFALGTAAVALALLATCWDGHRVADMPGFGLAVVAALLCGSRTIRLSDIATISVAFVVVFCTLIHVGMPEACVVAAASGLAASVLSPERYSRSPAVLMFAFASIVVTAWAAGQVLALAGGRPGALGTWTLAMPAALAAVTYHVVNCLLVAGIARLAGEGNTWSLFRQHLVSSTRAYYAGAGWAVVVHLAWQLSGPWTLIAAAPPLYSLHSALLRWARPRGET
jgi:hypothetical protein